MFHLFRLPMKLAASYTKFTVHFPVICIVIHTTNTYCPQMKNIENWTLSPGQTHKHYFNIDEIDLSAAS